MKRLNTISIGIKNLARQKIRTAVIVTFSVVLAASLFVSTILVESMQQSVEKTANRMGADIIVVPEEYETDYKDALFSGELCTFYMENKWCEPISQIAGVKKATPQLYLASLYASCCAVPLQLIAFDQETDFIVQPWLQEMNLEELKEGEVIVGDNVTGAIGDSVEFYNVPLKIVGRLERTDTSYDTCAFISFETARMLLKTEEAKKSSVGNLDPETLISTIAISVEKGADIKSVARNINFGIDNCPAKAYTTSGITSSVSESVDSFGSFSKVLNYLMFAMALLAIVCIFTITILQRKHEFGVLITIGATKQNLVSIILTEGVGIGFLGGVIGVAISGSLMLAFRDVILNQMKLPTFISDLAFYGKSAAFCVAVSLLTGVIASVVTIILVASQEPLTLIQEGNA